ncbi:hypothetical protein QQF64_033516 [Cirrhinus molitorella]|uniref:Uncharacterized protein n=1 Tax=Cirrhinus molitorella TaxID=172907 RepID=A0ABR3MU40_9TELE
MMAPGGADGERSHEGGMATDSRGPTDGSGAGGGGARGGDGEPMGQADGEDPEGHCGTGGTGDRCGDGDPEGRGGLRTEEEPEGRRSLTELEGWKDEA